MIVLARRHVAYGYRQLWSKLRRAGYIVNRKKVQWLLRLWGYTLRLPRPHCRSILGWSFTLRYRARDFSPALEMAWSTAIPYGVDKEEIAELVTRHDNGTQFTSRHYREVADGLGIKL